MVAKSSYRRFQRVTERILFALHLEAFECTQMESLFENEKQISIFNALNDGRRSFDQREAVFLRYYKQLARSRKISQEQYLLLIEDAKRLRKYFYSSLVNIATSHGITIT